VDEKIELLICLGASTAANCIPCFEHYYKKATDLGLTADEIQIAVELASKVKNGAHVIMRNSVRTLMGEEVQGDQCCSRKSASPCCS
jgi:alkylhydroperoxidase/carboxymuconolactone decarboxylase family protein YurZ